MKLDDFQRDGENTETSENDYEIKTSCFVVRNNITESWNKVMFHKCDT